jgi:Archaea bacterial proteins of unknown function
MEALQSYGRPFFGRAVKMTVRPLHLADIHTLTGLDAAEAVDALLMAGELSLLGEFPEASRTRAVLETVGSGERAFTMIAAAAGAGASPLPSGTLTPILDTLLSKRVLATDSPLSTKPDTKNKRYRIADPYLRFWLAFLQRGLPLVERGRGDVLLDRVERSWGSWRGRAVEPIIRESLMRLTPDEQWPDTEAVGGWWNRQNNPEIDLVGADRAPTARNITSSARSNGWSLSPSAAGITTTWCATCSPSLESAQKPRWSPYPAAASPTSYRSRRTGAQRTCCAHGNDGGYQAEPRPPPNPPKRRMISKTMTSGSRPPNPM